MGLPSLLINEGATGKERRSDVKMSVDFSPISIRDLFHSHHPFGLATSKRSSSLFSTLDEIRWCWLSSACKVAASAK